MSSAGKKKRNRKKKSKAQAQTEGGEGSPTTEAKTETQVVEAKTDAAPTIPDLSNITVQEAGLTAAQAEVLAALDPAGAARTKQATLQAAFGQLGLEEQKKHKFWNTQPVPQSAEEQGADAEVGEIETKTVDMVNKEGLPLPTNFEWAECDVSNPKEIDEVYTLLCENYVEDDDNMFRFDYSRDFLQWALQPPGYQKHLHVCVRVATGKKKLVGFITGIPADIAVHGKIQKMVEINFLCVHKKLRAKRLTPVLIKEVTRRVNLGGVWQAVYTAGVVLPKPVARNRYYHRSLNPKKLIDIGFSRLQQRMTLSMTIKLYKVPKTTQVPGMRKMKREDCKAACALLMNYLKKFKLHQVYTEEEFAHWFLTRDGVVYSYVVEDPITDEITDMISFYSLPSSIMGHPKYNNLKAAYSFYNVATKTKWTDLMNDALILAKQQDFDVFNALNVMENDAFLSDLKFGIGDGNLQYYLYNWRCPLMEPKEVGLVLL